MPFFKTVNYCTEPVAKKEIFGWLMYDFANSSYVTVVISYIYSVFFITYIIPESEPFRDTYWALTIFLATVIVVILSPYLGAIADHYQNKKKILFYLTLLCCSSTAALFWIEPGQLWLAIFLLVLSNCCWMISENFIASFIPEITTKTNIGKVTGIGWGIGYLGGLVSLYIVHLIITAPANTQHLLYIDQNQLAMIVVAAFYFICTLPSFALLKNRHITQQMGQDERRRNYLYSVLNKKYFLAIRDKYPNMIKFLLPFFFYSAAIAIVVRFFAIYLISEFSVSSQTLIMIGITLQVSALCGAISFGYIQDYIGAKPALLISLLWWLVSILAIYFVQPLAELLSIEIKELFVVIAIICGVALGATQNTSRAIIGLMSKVEDAALVYGVWGMVGKLAIILGMTFGPLADFIGIHNALILIIALFIISIAFTAKVKIEPNS